MKKHSHNNNTHHKPLRIHTPYGQLSVTVQNVTGSDIEIETAFKMRRGETVYFKHSLPNSSATHKFRGKISQIQKTDTMRYRVTITFEKMFTMNNVLIADFKAASKK